MTLEKLSVSPTFQALGSRVSALEASRATIASPVFTGTVTADNLIVNGGITDGANFGLYYDPTNPIIIFDSTDSFGYARGTNLYGFNIAGATICSITAANLTHVAKIVSPIFSVDTQFYLQILGGNPTITFDNGDAIAFSRSQNKFIFLVGNTAVASIDASGNLKTLGTITASTAP